MRDSQKPDHISLNTLIGRLREGRFVIPDFQREFEWEPWDIRELMKSIFLDYYIGSLLLWRGKRENFDALSCEDIYAYDGPQNPEYIVLDGQQRLTAMYYAFFAPDKPLTRRTRRAFYYLRVDKLMTDESDAAFYYDWRTRNWDDILTNQEKQFHSHIFPLSVVGAGGWELPNWVQGYEKYWREQADSVDNKGRAVAEQHARNAQMFGELLKGITEQYQISYIELDRDLEIEKVCDIFTQINSRGVRLDAFDLINALLKPKGLQLKHMWREASKRLEFVDSDRMNVYILQVMSIVQQAYCSPKYLYYLMPGRAKTIRDPDGARRKEILVPDKVVFERLWNNAVTALEGAIRMLQHPQEFGAISSKYLPYVSILPAFAALQAHIKTVAPGRKLEAQRKVKLWYWASVFTNRYSGSVESTTARDFLDVRRWIDDDNAEPALTQEFKSRFKNLELRKETKRGTSVYNGIFNLLVLQGARDWVTGAVPQYDDLDDHHIVPVAWGSKHLPGGNIHTILNRTPLTSQTNRHVILDRLPNTYLPELITQNGAAQVREILASHSISPRAQEILLRTPFTADDFEAFIAERQSTLQQAIENLLIKERLDLEPDLRELDEEIEKVELALRRVVLEGLNQHGVVLPAHVEGRVAERIQRNARRNAAFDLTYYATLEGKLEFLDLREVQDVLTSKAHWPIFSERFATKEALGVKFSQLAELRNSIRHSRQVDAITRKEGEAALLWFEHTNQKA